MDVRRLPAVLAVLGLAITGAGVTHLVSVGPAAVDPSHLVADILLVSGSGLGLLYAAYWHAAHEIADRHADRIAAWTATSTLAFAAVAVVSLHVGSVEVTREELYHGLRVAASVGLFAGVGVGTFEARALDSAAAAARSEARVRALEEEMERLSQLNAALRHYVLNSATVINGRIDRLESVVPPAEADALETISERSETMVTIVEHVNRLHPLAREQMGEVTVDLGSALEDAVASTPDPDVSVSVDPPVPGTTVRVAESFEEDLTLLVDAVLTVTGDDGTVEIECERRHEEIVLTFTASPLSASGPLESFRFESVESGDRLKFSLAGTYIDEYADLQVRDSPEGTLRFDLVLDRSTGGE